MKVISDFYIDIKKVTLAHEFVLDANQRCEYLSGRGQYGIIYVLKGSAKYSFTSGKSLKVAEGDLLFLSPKSSYSIDTTGEFKHYTINFIANEENTQDLLSGGQFFYITAQGRGRYKHIFKELVDVWNYKKIGYEMRAAGYVYELLSLIFADIHTKIYNTVAYNRLLPAKEYIDINFDRDIKVEDLANLVNMSVTNFRREWLKLFGTTSMQYKDQMRIAYAKECLSSGYYNVSEVAEKCGFEDVSYFVRFFKKHTGVSPGVFKNSLVL